jgi:hypothetical protein
MTATTTKDDKPFTFSLDEPIRIYSSVTFGQLRDALAPVKEYKDVYTRWAAIADKQVVVELMTQVILDKLEKRDRSPIAKKTTRTILSLPVIQFMAKELKNILEHSTHPFLTSKQDKNKKILETFTETARFLQGVGPHTTLTLDKGRDIMYPVILYNRPDEAMRPILWSEFINLVMQFIAVLPFSVQTNWAELYVQRFIEGYDLTVERFPPCVVPPIYGRPARPGTQEYTSCHLGMEYHMLIALYDVLFLEHEPKRQHEQPVTQEEHRAFRLPIVIRYVQEFQQLFEREHDITKDYTESQKEQFKTECTAHILSLGVTEDGYDWLAIINEVVKGTLLYM